MYTILVRNEYVYFSRIMQNCSSAEEKMSYDVFILRNELFLTQNFFLVHRFRHRTTSTSQETHRPTYRKVKISIQLCFQSMQLDSRWRCSDNFVFWISRWSCSDSYCILVFMKRTKVEVRFFILEHYPWLFINWLSCFVWSLLGPEIQVYC